MHHLAANLLEDIDWLREIAKKLPRNRHILGRLDKMERTVHDFSSDYDDTEARNEIAEQYLPYLPDDFDPPGDPTPLDESARLAFQLIADLEKAVEAVRHAQQDLKAAEQNISDFKKKYSVLLPKSDEK